MSLNHWHRDAKNNFHRYGDGLCMIVVSSSSFGALSECTMNIFDFINDLKLEMIYSYVMNTKVFSY